MSDFNLTIKFLSEMYASKKLYEKYCLEVDKKYGLSINDGEVLHQIYLLGGECAARDIVEKKWVSKSQVSKSVESLTDLGYITTQIDKNDRRFVRLRLSDAAFAVIDELEAATAEFFNRLFDGINENEISAINNLLAKIASNIEGENEK